MPQRSNGSKSSARTTSTRSPRRTAKGSASSTRPIPSSPIEIRPGLLSVPGESTADRLAEIEALREALAYAEVGIEPIEWKPQAHQIPPTGDEWWGWLLIGGRNAGKSAAVCAAMAEHADSTPCFSGRFPHRMGIIAPTLGDAVESVVYGDAGLVAHNPRIKLTSQTGGTFVRWPNGSRAKLFGTNTMEAVERLRAGGNRCFDLAEEIAAWRYLRAALEHMELGLRKGTTHWVGATTPKARPSIRKLNADPKVVKSRATSDDNAYADPEWLARIHERFDNTRQGLQEVGGEILDDVEGALWNDELIGSGRVHEIPKLLRVVIGVDPSWGTSNDEVGIVVVGLGIDRHAYIVGDLSGRMTPEEWGLAAGRAFMREWHSTPVARIVAERNFQGEQVKLVVKTTEAALDTHLTVEMVNASQGKRLRAEPVLALYQQGRVHHLAGAGLDGLEFQMTTWVPPDAESDAADRGDPPEARPDSVTSDDGEAPSKFSPDRLDALVFAVTDLMLSSSAGRGSIQTAEGQVPRAMARPGSADALPPALRRTVQRQLRRG